MNETVQPRYRAASWTSNPRFAERDTSGAGTVFRFFKVPAFGVLFCARTAVAALCQKG